MTYLPSLIKKIDDFCSLADSPTRLKKLAQDYGGGYSSPDDPEEPEEEGGGNPPHYDSLLNMSHQVDDPELALQLQTLAELYRYALQLGGGYSTIAQAINNLKSMYSDGSDSDIESILNGMIGELAKAAGGIRALSGKDNPSFVQRLVQLKQDIEARNQDERSGANDAYQEEISGQGQGAQTGETSEDLAEAGLTPEQAEIVNPAALGFADKEDPKTNKGWHTTGSGKAYKNWKEYYDNEKVSYEADLTSEQDPDMRKALEQLIDLLPVLSHKTQQALDLSNALRSDVDNPTEATRIKTELAAMNENLQKLKYARRVLKNRVRTNQLQKEQQKISGELQEATGKFQAYLDPEKKEKYRREAELLKQKLALNELAQSGDVYKAKERNYRLELVRQMSGGAFPGKDWIEKQQQKIEAASQLRKSKVAYDEKQSLERRQEHGALGEIVRRQKGRRGGGKEDSRLNQYDLDAATFNGLLDKLNEKINTSAHVARLNVTQEVDSNKKKVHNGLKTYVDAVSKAIQKKDNNAKLEAIKALKAQMVDWASRAPAIKAMARNVKWLPFFIKIKNDLTTIATWKTEAGWELNENKQAYIANVISGSQRLIQAYGRYYQGRGAPKGTIQPEIAFDNTVKYLGEVIRQLSKETGVTTATTQGKS